MSKCSASKDDGTIYDSVQKKVRSAMGGGEVLELVSERMARLEREAREAREARDNSRKETVKAMSEKLAELGVSQDVIDKAAASVDQQSERADAGEDA